MLDQQRFILTLSCTDAVGIVAAVAGFLEDNECFIIDSKQWGDAVTKTFFMRCEFEAQGNCHDIEALEQAFLPIVNRFSMRAQFYDSGQKSKLLVMVSKQSHCLNAILYRCHCQLMNADVVAVISNHNDVKSMVEHYDVPFHHLPVDKHNRAEQEAAVLDLKNRYEADLLVLARYMQVLTPSMVAGLKGQAINIHHSFLPSFKGAKPYHQAYDNGVKLIGATAHYVSDDLDEGPIIEQEVTRVDHSYTPASLVAKGQDVESKALIKAIDYHINRRVMLNGNKTVVF